MARNSRRVRGKSSRGSVIEQGRLRLVCVALFFFLCFGSISAQLVGMMWSHSLAMPSLSVADLIKRSAVPEDLEVDADPKRMIRANVVDRNGVLLATNLMTSSAFANPKEIKNPAEAAKQLGITLRMSQKNLLARLKKNHSFVWIKRHLTPKEQHAVNSLGIPGVYFLPEERRVYPYGNLLSHTLGSVGIDNKGLSGLERTFDDILTDSERKDPLQLSVDIRVQHILRDEMAKAMKEYRGIGAAGVVMDAHSGEVLAISSLPDYDPNKSNKINDNQRFNRTSLGLYEMGSTFKSLTLALALDSGLSYKSGYDASKPLRVAGHTISDYHGKNRWLSVPEIFVYSSNIGTARMLLDVGIVKQREFLKTLGLFDKVPVDIPETASPIVPDKWSKLQAITISYGHGMSVTPLHLVRAIAAMVNGGRLPNLGLTLDKERSVKRAKRVIDEETSELMRSMFRLVVSHGTGSKANIAGYRVGGKTGTAEKIMANGRYSQDAKISSFVSVFPVDDPQYVVYIMVDDPKPTKASYGYATGGWVAAPAVGRVIERMSPLVGVAPSFDTDLDKSEKFWVNTDPVNQSRKNPLIHAASY